MDSAQPTGAEPLGGEFWKVQFAQAVSMIADVSVMWILLWWLLVHRKGSSTPEQTMIVLWPMAAGWIVYAIALPLSGVLADHFERKRLAAIGCAMRAAVHLVLSLALVLNPVSLWWVPLLYGVSAIGGALFDASSICLIPHIVPSAKKERGVTYSLVLPRAGFFLTAMICLFLLAILDAKIMTLCGAVFLLLAAKACASIEDPTRVAEPTPHTDWLRELVEGPAQLLRQPRLFFWAFMTGLLNFVIYPLYWVAPNMSQQAIGAKGDLSGSLEFSLVAGVLLGTWLTPRLCAPDRLRPDQVVSLSFVFLAIGLCSLGLAQDSMQACLASVGIGVALMQIMGLSGTVAVLGSPDSHRGRVVALFAVLFEIGGWAGSVVLSPLMHRYGAGLVLSVAAAPFGILGFFGLIDRRTPALLKR